jgi:hypothetical protein
MIDKNEYLKSIQDKVASEREGIDLRLSKFAKAGDSIEYKTALQDIPYLKEPEAVKKGMQLLKNKHEDVTVRLLVLQKALSEIGKNTEYLRDCLLILQDGSDQVELRRTILSAFRAFSFGSKLFASLRVEYMTALRSLLDDPDALLREMAAEDLAKDKDEYLQRRLLDGLTGRTAPIVSTAKAIQLLGYDIHAEHYPIVRGILQNPASDEAIKLEAIHVLANDEKSKDLLAHLMMDKGQEMEVRMSSATALKASHFEDFIKIAKPVVVDEEEEEDLRAVVLNALMFHSDSKALYDDEEFNQSVTDLQSLTTSGDLRELSTRFLDNAKRHSKKR